MNKIYKLVWSKVRNCWVAVAEIAKSHSKTTGINSGYVDKRVLEGRIGLQLQNGYYGSAVNGDIISIVPNAYTGNSAINEKPISTDFKITVAAIVKNEAKNVPQWVQAARSCADEIVVVDTGSTDGTVERFADYGIKCFHYKWNDDFASAKNYMISLCHGDWIVLLDGDEWFREGCDVRKAIAKHHNNSVEKAIIADWICLDSTRNNTIMFSGGAVRAFRNSPEIRYFRKVHENLTIQYENFVFEPEFKMYHTGYSGDVNRSKHERNLRIMRTMFDFDNGKVEYPTDWRYIQDTYAGLGDFEKSLWASDQMLAYNVPEYSAASWITRFNVLFAMKASMTRIDNEFEYCFRTVPSVSGFRFLASIYYFRNGVVSKALDNYIEGLRMLMGPQDKVAQEHTYWRMYMPEASALASAVYLQNKQVEAALYACKVCELYCGQTDWTNRALADVRQVMNQTEDGLLGNISERVLPVLQFGKKAVLATALASSLTIGMVGVANPVFAACCVLNGGGCASGTNATITGGRYNTAGKYYSYVDSLGKVVYVSPDASVTNIDGYAFTISGNQITVQELDGNHVYTLTTYYGDYSSVSGGKDNAAAGNSSSVSGGSFNVASGEFSYVAGGCYNIASGKSSSAIGGRMNTATGDRASVFGGCDNIASCYVSSVFGGCANIANGESSSVVGGRSNTASGTATLVAGGYCNTASGENSSVSGGCCNIASGCCSLVNGGVCNTASGCNSSVFGGYRNTASGYASSVSGGYCNTASGSQSSVIGGRNGFAYACYSTAIGGGITGMCSYPSIAQGSVAIGKCATTIRDYEVAIGSACAPVKLGGNLTVTGTQTVTDGTNTKTWSDLLTASGGGATAVCFADGVVLAGCTNTASGCYSSVSGGECNTASGCYSSVSGGDYNKATNSWSSVAGGYLNTASGCHSSVIGGTQNTASGCYSSVVGGVLNKASCYVAVVIGGCCNIANVEGTLVAGGCCNTASGCWTTVIGGCCGIAYAKGSTVIGGGITGVSTCANTAQYSVAIGKGAKTTTNYQVAIGSTSAPVAIGGNLTVTGTNTVSDGTTTKTWTQLLNASGGGGGATAVCFADGVVLAGCSNTVSGCYSSVSGGCCNTASCYYSSVSGGACNIASGCQSSVSGGRCNTANCTNSSVSGGNSNIASGTNSSVSGGRCNTASCTNSSVSGGCMNFASGEFSSISGGEANHATGYASSVSGGYSNTACGWYTSVTGGMCNTANGDYSSVIGGSCNTASGGFSSVFGGCNGFAYACYSTVVGGGIAGASACNQTALGSVAIGKGATTTRNYEVAIGSACAPVKIGGNLTVTGTNTVTDGTTTNTWANILNAGSYTLPATASELGGVKIGSNITNSNGTISLTKANVTAALGYTPPTADTDTHYSTPYGISSTAAATAAKEVTVDDFSLDTGSVVSVKFSVTNTVNNPTLNVNGTGAKPIYYRGAAISKGYLAKDRTYQFVYNGTQYELVGDVDTNTTYSKMTAAELEAGTVATARSISADVLNPYIKGLTDDKISALSVCGTTITYTKGDGTTGTITTQDTDTHYTTHLYAGSGTAANATTTNGNTKIAIADNSTVNNTVTIKGTGATTVTSDANGVITINSTDNNTTYSAGNGISLSGTTFSAKPYNGITVDSNGIGVKAGTNVTVNSNGVSVTGSGSVASGNTGLISGGTLFTEGRITADGTFAKKANSIATNITALDTASKNAIKGLSVSGTTITYTKGDGTTGTITTQDNNTTYSAFTGATSSAAGTAGLVKAPAAGDQAKFLRGDGTWAVDNNTTYSAGAGLSLSGTTFSVNTNGSIASGNTGVLNGGTVYSEVRPTADGTFAKKANTTAANITALDTAAKNAIKGLSVSGTTITYTKGDGTTGTITTQDNNTTYTNMSASELNTGTATTARSISAKVIADYVTDKVSAETTARNTAISSEATARADADTALDARVDESIKGLSVSGKTITYTKGDGTTGTITTQDTNTTYTAGNGVALSGTTFSAKAGTNVSVDSNGINVVGNGSVASGNTGLVSGGTLFTENRITADGTFAKKANTTAANITALDTAAKNAIKGLSVSGQTITYTKGDGTTGTITTQDTNTTYDNMSATELNTGTATTARSISAKTIANYVTGKVSAETTAWTTAINSEATTRANADTALETRIDNAITAYESADTDLSNRIGSLSADGNYIKKSATNNVSANLTALDTQLKTTATAVSTETTNRTNADTALSNRIGSVASDGTFIKKSATNDVATNLTALDTAAKNAIKGLSVSGTTITYTKGDGTTGTITTQDNNTTYGTGTADNLTTGTDTTGKVWTSKILADYVKGQVATETTNRTTAITNEASARSDADTALSNRIGSLTADGNYIKKSATNNVSANLTALDMQLKTTTNAVSTETTNRTSADTALSNRIGTVSADGNYIKASTSKNIAENVGLLDTAVKANATSIASEITNRTTAVTNEATARSDADTALGTRIDNAVSAYESADTGLSNRIGSLTADGNYIKKSDTKNISENLGLLDTQLKTTTTAVSTEATTRANADTALGTRIDNVTSAYQSADTGLSNRIGSVASDGTFIKKSATNNVATNLTALDTAAKNAIKDLSVSGTTITYTKGDGTTGTITTQDTTYSAGNGLLLSNGSFSVKTDGQVASGNTGIVTGGTVYDALEARIGQITVQNDAQNTVALGDNSSVSGDGAVAVGSGSSGTGESSVAVGDTSTSSGEGSVAVGSEASASSEGAVALGSGSSANSGDSNNNAVAIGNNAQAGTDSAPVSNVTAIGGGSTASADSGTAIGASSTASGTGSSAIGQGSSATAQGASALGEESTASGIGSVAIGSDATASSTGAIALGNDAVANSGASNSNATAIGNNAQAGSTTTPVTDATAIGGNSIVSGNSGTAVGATSSASGINTTAIGSGTTASGAGASAIGQGSVATSADATAVGHGASATGTDSVALGSDSQANSTGAISIGNDATANSGTSNSNAVAIGNNAHAGTSVSSIENATAIGGTSRVTGASGTALGANTFVSGTNATAIGSGASASGNNSIALGAGSIADVSNTVSVGTSTSQRTISNVAAGISATDAATVGQTYVMQNGSNTTVTEAGTNAIGQKIYQMTVTTDGQVTSGNTGIVTGGTVFDALEARIGQVTVGNNAQNTVAVGDGSSVSGDGAIAVGTGSSGSGEGSVAVGNTSSSTGERSVAVGSNTTAESDNTVVIGAGSTVTGVNSNNSVAIGQQTNVFGSDSVALGGGSAVTGMESTAIGGNTVVNNDNSVALGFDSNASVDNVVSVGHKATDKNSANQEYGTDLFRRVINVADAVNEHDAVTKGQLDTLMTDRVGSLASNGNYVLKDNTMSANLLSLDTQLKSVDTSTIKYDGTDHSLATLGGTDGTRLTNLKAGVLSATSTDAVTGAQLHATNQNITGFVTDINRNKTSIASLNTSVTAALGTVSSTSTLVNTLNDLKADASLNNLTAAGRNVIATAAANAVQEYMSTQQNNYVPPTAPMMYSANPNTLNVTNAGNGSLHVGEGSYVNGTSSIAIGVGNQVNANNSGAFGDPSVINADESYVLGNDDTINTGATGSFVVGNDSVSSAKGGLTFGSNNTLEQTATDSVALGNNAMVSGANSVALGSGSTAVNDNVVSVGSDTIKRKITNVMSGEISENSTDAVTGSQLFVTNEKVKANEEAIAKKADIDASNINVDDWTAKLGTGQVAEGNTGLVNGGTVFTAIQKVQNNQFIQQDGEVLSIGSAVGGNTIDVSNNAGEGRVITGVVTDPKNPMSVANVDYVNTIGDSIIGAVNNNFGKMDAKMNKMGANAAAMASLTPASFEGDEKWSLSAGVGNYRGETAGAIGAFYRPAENVMMNVRGSFGNSENMVGAAVSVSLSKGDIPGVTKRQLANTVNRQANAINVLQQNQQKDQQLISDILQAREQDQHRIAEQDKRIAELENMVQTMAKQMNIGK